MNRYVLWLALGKIPFVYRYAPCYLIAWKILKNSLRPWRVLAIGFSNSFRIGRKNNCKYMMNEIQNARFAIPFLILNGAIPKPPKPIRFAWIIFSLLESKWVVKALTWCVLSPLLFIDILEIFWKTPDLSSSWKNEWYSFPWCALDRKLNSKYRNCITNVMKVILITLFFEHISRNHIQGSVTQADQSELQSMLKHDS